MAFALCSCLPSALCSLPFQRQRQSRDHRQGARHSSRSDHHALGCRGRARSRTRGAPAGGDRIAGGLSAVIDRVLMLNEVRRVAPPEPTPAAIDARVARIRQRFGAAAELSRLLAARGLDETVLRMYAADDLRLASYLDERFSAAAQPTDEEIRQAGESARQRLTDDRRQAAGRRMDRGAAPARGRDGPSTEVESSKSLPSA